MWTYFKSKRLNILVVLAGFIYVFLVVSSFVDGSDDFLRGYSEGAQSDRSIDQNMEPMRSYYLSMKPIKGFASYPDSLYNSISGKQVYVCMNSVISNNPVKLQSSSIVAFRVLSRFLIFFFLIVYIVIPFHFFRFIGLIRKNIFFESENIRLLRCLGIELCFIYIGILLYSFLNLKINSTLFSFSDYELVMDYMDGIWLLFGIVVLMIAEVLAKALSLKEEQELTI